MRGRSLGLAALLAMGASGAMAQVSVRFVEPERYTDAENRLGSGLTVRVTIGEVRRILEDLGRSLPAGRSLAVDVLDIDLAGFERPGTNLPFSLRVVDDASPPRFRLRYVLSEGRRRIMAGDESVTEIDFLSRNARLSSGAFDHERALLRDWFRRRIVEGRAAPG